MLQSGFGDTGKSSHQSIVTNSNDDEYTVCGFVGCSVALVTGCRYTCVELPEV